MSAPSSLYAVSGEATFFLNGVRLIADPDGALFAPDARTLIVADLHLEKGSSFARRGMMLPPYDTAMTLARLDALIARRAPRAVIALGDSFHDCDGPARFSEADATTLALMQQDRDWIWIAGNHDAALHRAARGARAVEARLEGLILRHTPKEGFPLGEIAGHLHPVAILGGRRRAFVTDGRRLLMPAFGAYAGGVNLHADPIRRLFSGRQIVYVLGRDPFGCASVYPVCASRCGNGA